MAETKQTKPLFASMTRYNAAENTAWYKGDSKKPRVILAKGKEAGSGHRNSDNNLIKNLMQGDFYAVRANNYSSIQPTGALPPAVKDSSNFMPGIPGDMTKEQARSFFRTQEHDADNNTMVKNLVNHKYMTSKLSEGMNACESLVQRNKQILKETQRLKKLGQTYTMDKSKYGQTRRQGVQGHVRKIMEENSDLLMNHAVPEVTMWLEKSSDEDRQALGNLLRSIRKGGGNKRGGQHGDAGDFPGDGGGGERSRTPEGVRPGTASVMERSERERERALAAAAAKAGVTLPIPETGENRLFNPMFMKSRTVGNVSDEAGVKEGRMLELKKLVMDKIYIKCKNVRNAWRWFDSECNGFVDETMLHNTISEFQIECDREDVENLHRHMDIDGDGVVSFEDFNASLFPLAHDERDYFGVTRRPCLKLANEEMYFEGWENDVEGREGDETMELAGTLNSNANNMRPSTGLARPTTGGGGERPRTSNFRVAPPKPSRGGTPAYMAPPQASRPQTSAGGRTDILVLDNSPEGKASNMKPPSLPLGRMLSEAGSNKAGNSNNNNNDNKHAGSKVAKDAISSGPPRPRSVAGVGGGVARAASPSVHDLLAKRRNNSGQEGGAHNLSRPGSRASRGGGGGKPADLFMMRPQSKGGASIQPDALRSDLPNAYWPQSLLDKGFHLQTTKMGAALA